MEKMFVLLLLGFGSIVYAQNANEFPVIKGDYFGQIPPCDTPVVFARGIISDSYQQHGAPSFSPEGNKVFWQTNKLRADMIKKK